MEGTGSSTALPEDASASSLSTSLVLPVPPTEDATSDPSATLGLSLPPTGEAAMPCPSAPAPSKATFDQAFDDLAELDALLVMPPMVLLEKHLRPAPSSSSAPASSSPPSLDIVQYVRPIEAVQPPRPRDNDISTAVGPIDWDAIEIDSRWEEEERQEIISEKGLYSALGLSNEDEIDERQRRQGCSERAGGSGQSTVGIDASVDKEVGDAVPNERRINYNPLDPEIAIGSLFPNMKECRIAMRQYAINKEFELKVEATDTTRYRGYCASPNCPWRVNARPEMKGSPTIIVTVLVDVHNCTSSNKRRTTTPSKAWVAAKALPELMKKPFMGTKDLQTLLQDKFKCVIGYDTVWKGQQKALEELYGTWEESFRLLFRWKAAVLEKMPDSIIEIDIGREDGKPYFRSFFCAFGPCIKGFIEGCRPYLSVDSTALNGRWNGHLPAATAVDGHNWMFPVAFGFFDGETEVNWIWFMSQLHKAVGHLNPLAICTDAAKGLEKAVELIFPNAERRECFRHLMGNYVKYYGGSEHMYPAARSYRRHVYEQHIANVKCVPAIAQYLDVHHNLLWYRCGFNPAIKCDYITNNIAEVFNNWIKDIKDLPVCELAEKIREKVMVLFHRRRRIGEKLEGKILPSIIHLLKVKTRGLGHLSVSKSDNYAAEIRDENNCHVKHIVNAYVHECTCEEWQHTGKPCQHALCLIISQQFRDVGMENFVDDCYSVENFRRAYEGRIQMVGDKSFWPEVDDDDAINCGAPLAEKTLGRRRKNRIKGCLEGGSGKKASRNEDETEKQKKMMQGKVKCPRCGELGHRQSSYKCPLNGTKKRQFLISITTYLLISITSLYFFQPVGKESQGLMSRRVGSPSSQRRRVLPSSRRRRVLPNSRMTVLPSSRRRVIPSSRSSLSFHALHHHEL